MRCLTAFALCLALSGCASSGHKITQQQFDQVQAGKTTTADLIGLFGEPNSRVYNSDGTQTLIWSYVYVGFAGIGTQIQTASMNIGSDGTVQGYTRSGNAPVPSSAGFAKPVATAPLSTPASGPALDKKAWQDQQLKKLQESDVSYEEYQVRYKKIMGE